MPITRRRFIKRSAGALSIALMAPQVTFSYQPQSSGTGGSRKILVLIQLIGGNDGLNTIIPYNNSRYHQLRPNLAFKEQELKADDGASTVINSEFGFHPAMKELVDLYQQGKLAAVMGIGYPNPDLSHGFSTRIWQAATTNQLVNSGWLGRYIDNTPVAQNSLANLAVGAFSLPRVFFSNKVTVPLVERIGVSAFTNNDIREHETLVKLFRENSKREFPANSFLDKVAKAGVSAEEDSNYLQSVVQSYQPAVEYPEDDKLAQSMRIVAALSSLISATMIFHVSYPAAFDTHALQIGTINEPKNKFIGVHANEMRRLSRGIKLLYDDLVAKGLEDEALIMTYSEFGRRPNENSSLGTDHGTASNIFLVGNKVKGGDLYGLQPSLNAVDFDTAGNLRFTTDFRSVYATLLDRWLVQGNSEVILGGQFPHLGFL